MVIQSNLLALGAHRNLQINNRQVARNIERLSSGFRINRAADGASGLAISERMRGQIRGLRMAEQNTQQGINLIQTADGALQETHAILQRMRELSVKAANGTYMSRDRELIELEFQALKEEIDRIAQSTHYNGIRLLDGSLGREVRRLVCRPGEPGIPGSPDSPSGPPTPPPGLYEISGGTFDSSINITVDTIITGNISFEGFARIEISPGATLWIAENSTVSAHLIPIALFQGATLVNLGTIASSHSPTAATIVVSGAFYNFGNMSSGTWVSNASGVIINHGITSTMLYNHGTIENFGTIGSVSENTGIIHNHGTRGVVYNVGAGIVIDHEQENESDPEEDVPDECNQEYVLGRGLILQIGANGGLDQRMIVFIENMGARYIGARILDDFANIWETSIATREEANAAISVLDGGINMVSAQRAKLGAYQNRLEHTLNSLGVAAENLTASESTIRDTDMAAEMLRFTQATILSQAAQAMLTQSSQLPQGVMTLLR